MNSVPRRTAVMAPVGSNVPVDSWACDQASVVVNEKLSFNEKTLLS